MDAQVHEHIQHIQVCDLALILILPFYQKMDVNWILIVIDSDV